MYFRFSRSREGEALIGYALIIVLIAFAAAWAVERLGRNNNDNFVRITVIVDDASRSVLLPRDPFDPNDYGIPGTDDGEWVPVPPPSPDPSDPVPDPEPCPNGTIELTNICVPGGWILYCHCPNALGAQELTIGSGQILTGAQIGGTCTSLDCTQRHSAAPPATNPQTVNISYNRHRPPGQGSDMVYKHSRWQWVGPGTPTAFPGVIPTP